MTTERVGPGPVNRFFQKVNNIAVGWPMMLIFNMRHFNVPKLHSPAKDIHIDHSMISREHENRR